jgi:hypothetical protein
MPGLVLTFGTITTTSFPKCLNDFAYEWILTVDAIPNGYGSFIIMRILIFK